MLPTQFKKFLTSYLFTTGIVSHLMIITFVVAIPLIFQEPIHFFLGRISHHLVHSGNRNQQVIGDFMQMSGLSDNWGKPSSNQLFMMQPISQWQGQGASVLAHNSKNHFLQSNYSRAKTHYIHSNQELLSTLKKVQAGETLLLMPGTYLFSGRNIPITRAGTNFAPITLKSSQLGLVKIEFNMLDGFLINAPFWTFENLDIRGVCNIDSRCEHAFHIVGKGKSFILKNSIIHDFNAPIKVNGESTQTYYPDNGRIEKNTFYNSKVRNTKNPVNTLNIDSVNNWVVSGNLIADFAMAKGGRISYGVYMKGNGKNGIFENNLIICERNLPADHGTRIGLSLGGGGTEDQYCRHKSCNTEFTGGIIRNNIILNCSHDVGIYLNRASHTQIYNNLLFNTLGIDVRFGTSTATISNNIISGRIKARDNGSYAAKNNVIDPNCLSPSRDLSSCSFASWYWDISTADLRLSGRNNLQDSISIEGLNHDFCHHQRTSSTDIGPIQYRDSQQCTPRKM